MILWYVGRHTNHLATLAGAGPVFLKYKVDHILPSFPALNSSVASHYSLMWLCLLLQSLLIFLLGLPLILFQPHCPFFARLISTAGPLHYCFFASSLSLDCYTSLSLQISILMSPRSHITPPSITCQLPYFIFFVSLCS